MNRKFQLEEVIDKNTVDTVRFDSILRAQKEPWGPEVITRTITERDVSNDPYVPDLILNVWFQPGPDSEWVLLD